MNMFFPCLLFVALISGQLIRIPLWSGVTVYPHDMALVFLYLWMLWKKGWPKHITSRKLFYPLLTFIGIGIMSLLMQIPTYPVTEVLAGSAYLVRFVLYAWLYFVIAEEKDTKFWLRGLYSVGVVMGTLGIMQFFIYPDLRNVMYLGWDPHYYRLFSTLLDPNFMGIILLLTFLLGGVVLEKKQRLLPLLLQSVVGVAYILTFSRSAYVAGFSALLFYAVAKRQWKYLLIGCIVLLCVLVIPKKGGYSASMFRLESSLARVTNWTESVQLIEKSPVIGHGFNMLRSVKTPDWQKTEEDLSHATSGVDNSILFVGVTTGVLGLGAFFWMLFVMGKMGKVLLQRKKTTVFGMVYLLSFIGILVHSMFINSFFYPWVMIWLWILTGIGEKNSKDKGQ